MSLAHNRQKYDPPLPAALKVSAQLAQEKLLQVNEEMRALFPHTYNQQLVCFEEGRGSLPSMRIGVVLSGGQAPGGHNVIVALRDSFKGKLFGFLNGPSGILAKEYSELDNLEAFRNSGGFDMIGSGRTKIETNEQLAQALDCVKSLQLDGLVIIGGDDSNTNAALLAEYFLEHGCSCSVVGVPKTIDGDLKNGYVEASFGFDTASKIYSELIGNICRDALSAKKYYHFVRLMGRSASHMTLECALKTHPNFTIIGEEVRNRNLSLMGLAQTLVDLIQKRADAGKNYGVVLVPEGLVEFIPEMEILIRELNRDPENLSKPAKATFEALPEEIQKQLLLDRDPHGNVQVAHIETEKLLIACCKKLYLGKLNAVSHYFGYEGRCGFPTNFDAAYCSALGHVAAQLIAAKKSGYMCALKHLHGPVSSWQPYGVPIVSLMHMEERKGKLKPVIAKALVDLHGEPFQQFVQERNRWGMDDDYRYPGPIQYFGPSELTDETTLTLKLEQEALFNAH